MMGVLTAVADVISFTAFTVAMVMTLTMKSKTPLVTRSVRYVFAAAMGLYALVGMFNVLQIFGITGYFDAYEDFLELLFMPAIVWTASAVYLNSQIETQRQLARAMQSQNDLLLSIVDTVPGGVIVLDITGGITFSNEGAERILGLQSDTGGSLHITPSWTLRNPLTGHTVTLGDIATAGVIVRRPFIAEWPDRHSTALTLSATPMTGRSGKPEGSVVAFEDVTGR